MDATLPVAADTRPPKKRARDERRATKQNDRDSGTWTRCMSFQERKGRYCNLPRAPSSQYCGHHDPTAFVGGERIPCPVDGSHSIFARDLRSHLERCESAAQAAVLSAQSFYARGVNAGCAPADEAGGAARVRCARGDGPGGLSRLLDSRDAGGVDVASLCARLLEWADATPAAFSPPGHAMAARAALPILREALAATLRGAPDAVAEDAAAIAALGASKQSVFRHEYQQVSILSHLFDAIGVLESSSRGAGETALGAALLDERSPGALASLGAEPNAVSANTTFLELGAGRGGLSLTLARFVPRPALVLVDRASARAGADTTLRRDAGESAPLFTRVRVDLADVSLRGVPQLFGAAHTGVSSASARSLPVPAPESAAPSSASAAPSSASAAPSSASGRRVVAMGKHLCGAATDLALRSLVSAFSSTTNPGDIAGDGTSSPEPSPLPPGSSASTLSAIAIATCCHHACEWTAYVGKSWWRETLRATPAEFECARVLSSWFTLEKGFVEGGEEDEHKSAAPGDAPEETPSPARQFVASLDTATRARIGRAAKRAIDAGRVSFLGRAHLYARLASLSSCLASLENCLILASI
jgi:tRNA:m4X modification enzyme